MTTSADPTRRSSRLGSASRPTNRGLCLLVLVFLYCPAAMAEDASGSEPATLPGALQVYFPPPGLLPPCECMDVTDIDVDGNRDEWRSCADINGYNEFLSGCITIDGLSHAEPPHGVGPRSNQIFFPPPGFLPACECQDVTDLDSDGSTQERRACAVINGYNEFQKGCIQIDTGKHDPGSLTSR